MPHTGDDDAQSMQEMQLTVRRTLYMYIETLATCTRQYNYTSLMERYHMWQQCIYTLTDPC